MADLAYIVLARNDLDANDLQITDLVPNSSQCIPAYSPVPQTGYLSHYVQNDTVATTDAGGGALETNADYYGLAAYLIDNVEMVGAGANDTLTATMANGIAALILDEVAAGNPLTLSDINTAINAFAGVSNSDLDGTVANSESTGSVAGVLRILRGEVYKLPASSAVSGAGGAFPGTGATHTPVGFFVTAPNLTKSIAGGFKYNKTSIVSIPAATQSGTQDVTFRKLRTIIDCGELHMSVAEGQLSHLVDDGFAWINEGFTYGAAGTALDIGGGHIPATGIARGVVVYDDDGNVIGGV
jgi:hypothetical protein